MKLRFMLLMLGCLAAWPLASRGEQDLQARFEKSLQNAKAISKVEVEWLDTMTITDPTLLKYLKVNQPEYSRTFQYSFIAAGQKYRATSKLISRMGTNLAELTESTFDGKTYTTYKEKTRAMTKSTLNGPMEGLSPNNPLIEPFAFLNTASDTSGLRVLRFTDITAADFAQGLVLPTGERSNDVLEISLPGQLFGKQPTKWKVTFDATNDSFQPKTIEWIAPGQHADTISQLLNYTNLGAYHFPSRIEWATYSYPPTSPPTVTSSGSVTLITARIPDQADDSVFTLEAEEKSAVSIWDWDVKNFTDAAHVAAKRYAQAHPLPKIYDESADGATQIAAALVTAKKENKHVLLQFGANWCTPCHTLHTFFETNTIVSEELSRDYVSVMVDMNQGHNQATTVKYGHPTRFGLPALAILDADDTLLTTQGTGPLEADHGYSPDKVLAFLKAWAPKKSP
ncbi:MAG TPA: thioredoxin family protein [Verrucomicrobiae bacterium]|jgi:protein disulfide-isomerase